MQSHKTQFRQLRRWAGKRNRPTGLGGGTKRFSTGTVYEYHHFDMQHVVNIVDHCTFPRVNMRQKLVQLMFLQGQANVSQPERIEAKPALAMHHKACLRREPVRLPGCPPPPSL